MRIPAAPISAQNLFFIFMGFLFLLTAFVDLWNLRARFFIVPDQFFLSLMADETAEFSLL